MTDTTFDFISAKGEMADLVRAKDWESTKIGKPESWPSSLRTTLSIVLNSKFPMFLFWGKDLACFYNDAYRPSLGRNGKHPSMLGSTAKESWEEVFDFVTDRVFDTGEPEMFNDVLIPIFRNGQMEDVHWTFCYSAVKDKSGEILGILVACMETTAQVEFVRQLEESKEELKFTIEAAELGTFDINTATNTFTANNRLKEWLGVDQAKKVLLVSEDGIDALNENDQSMVAQGIADAINPEKKAVFDLKYSIIQPKTNREIFVHGKGKALFLDEKETAVRFHGTLRDITEQKRFTDELERQIRIRTKKLDKANQSLKEKNLILEQRNKELRSFSYISSHDLQEPLRKIQTFSSRILEKEYENLSEKGKNYFNRMRSSANRMQSLIQDLLSYSKIDHGESKFVTIAIDTLIEEVKEELSEELQEQKATITTECSEEVKVIHFQFFQLFYNLFTNSLKFAKKDTPSVITVKCETVVWVNAEDDSLEEGKTYYRIEVKDNGIGFEPNQNKLIFGLFQRLHGMSKFQGTGIGLAIVKKVVENHHGKIEAYGVPNEGATFLIHVPVPA
jgi:hypothetical protein